MKIRLLYKKLLFIIQVIVLSLYITPISAQGFLDKISKGLDKIDKEMNKIDNALNPMDAETKACLQKATNGEKEAQLEMGVIYYEGKKLPQNYSEAIKWFQKSAEQEYSNAQAWLGYMYAEGLGVDKNSSKAAFWYEKAADQGHALSQYVTGLFYLNGNGVTKDFDKSIEWFTKSANNGFPNAQYELGQYYEVILKKAVDAEKWYQKAAEQKYTKAEEALAKLQAVEKEKKEKADKDAALAAATANKTDNTVLTTSSVTSSINIPKTVITTSGWNKDIKYKPVYSSGIKTYKLDKVLTKDQIKGKISRKQLYKGTNGTIDCVVSSVPDHMDAVYLVTYSNIGNLIASQEVAKSMYYSSDDMVSYIEGNKVRISYSWAEPLAEWGEGITDICIITDNLQIQSFSWPPKSFPSEVPFMTHETDGETPLFWEIESIICTGKEITGNGSYKFIVKGKGKEGAKSAGSATRNIKFEPMNSNHSAAAKAVVCTLPAVKVGESFEVEFKGRFDEKAFKRFQISR